MHQYNGGRLTGKPWASERSYYTGEAHGPVPQRRRGLHENADAAREGNRLTTPGERLRVVLCDDHESFRHGVAEMLSFAGEVEVVGEASTHEEAVTVVSVLKPDVVLLDLEVPGGSMGADESMGRMLEVSPPPRVVVFSMHDEPGMVRRFLSRGAVAYLPKSVEMGKLVEAVRDAGKRSRETPGGGDRPVSRGSEDG
jgi:DNA-binding NarL/FixJ family response regulator